MALDRAIIEPVSDFIVKNKLKNRNSQVNPLPQRAHSLMSIGMALDRAIIVLQSWFNQFPSAH